MTILETDFINEYGGLRTGSPAEIAEDSLTSRIA
jgi:hypothetical protein